MADLPPLLILVVAAVVAFPIAGLIVSRRNRKSMPLKAWGEAEHATAVTNAFLVAVLMTVGNFIRSPELGFAAILFIIAAAVSTAFALRSESQIPTSRRR